MRFGIRQRREPSVGYVIIFALIGKGLAAEGLHDDFQGFLEPVFAFQVVNAHGVVGPDIAAPAHAKLEPSLTNLVHGGGFFGYPQGMHQGQHMHRRSHPQMLGPRADRAGDYHLSGMHRPIRCKVSLAQPNGIQTQIICQVNQLEGLPEGIRVRASRRWKVQENSKIHKGLPPETILLC